MKLKITLLLFTVINVFSALAQEVPKKVIVEHFTNTLCGTCASRNPGFYTNYNTENTGNMVHLTIHPSSPYSACILNKHDKNANDDRTKDYSIFGSTPRFIINGTVISTSSNLTSASLFTPFIGQTSPISLNLSQQKFGSDSVRVRVVIRTEAAHTLGAQKLYVVLAENTVFYNAPNGEDEHYDVMRKPLLGNTGIPVTLPTNVGDSLVFVETVSTHADWDVSRMFALAVLQNENDKSVTQTEALDASDNSNVVLGVSKLKENAEFSVYPNPATQFVKITASQSGDSKLRVLAIDGTEVHQCEFSDQMEIDLSAFPSGLYFVTIENEQGVFTQKVVKSDF